MDFDFHNLPVHDGVSGDWAIETFEVGEIESDKTRLRADYTRDNDAFIPAGCYRRLVKLGDVVMSNTPMEVRTCAEFLENARGRLLINGLGLGMVLHAVLQLPEVTQVTVVERELDVIKLVGDAFSSDPRVEIIHADAFLYCPPAGVTYDSAWHDIWHDLSASNLDGMEALEQKYLYLTNWQGCWGKHECEQNLLQRQELDKRLNAYVKG